MTFKGLIITHRGFEDISEREVKEIVGDVKTSVGESVVFCELKGKEDFLRLIYNGRSFIRVLYSLAEFEFDEFFKRLEKEVKKVDFSKWVRKGRSFRVRCKRFGEHNFSSEEVAGNVGELVIKSLKYKVKVDLENPDVIVYVYIHNNHCYIGIDLAGFDLSKRSYNVFSIPSSFKPSFAYCLSALTGLKGVFIDPICGNGMIVIEAAMKLNRVSPHYFDKDKFHNLDFFDGIDIEGFFDKEDEKSKKDGLDVYGYDGVMNHVQSAQKNAKIANINKFINFSRTEVEWLDTKFKKESVDAIVTRLPDLSKRINEKDVLKVYKELFYSAEYVMRKKGKVVVAVRNDEAVKKIAREYKFKLVEEREAWQGKDKLRVIVWGK